MCDVSGGSGSGWTHRRGWPPGWCCPPGRRPGDRPPLHTRLQELRSGQPWFPPVSGGASGISRFHRQPSFLLVDHFWCFFIYIALSRSGSNSGAVKRFWWLDIYLHLHLGHLADTLIQRLPISTFVRRRRNNISLSVQ